MSTVGGRDGWANRISRLRVGEQGSQSAHSWQSLREFAESPLLGVPLEQLAAVQSVFDLRDLVLSTGEFDMVADLEMGHMF